MKYYCDMTPEIRISKETSIAGQRLGKYIPAATNTQATIEYLPLLCNNGEAAFSAWPVQSGYKEEFRSWQ
jgi:hypothetical protein